MLALLIVLFGVGLWVGKGVNVGWTKTSIAIMQTDPVTEIRYPTYKSGFYPGIDFLAMCLLLGGGLYGASFAVRRKYRILINP